MGEIRLNPNLAADLRRSPELHAALRRVGTQVADEAERLGREVSHTYETRVEDTDEGVRVIASTAPLGAAGWIEFGSANNPPAAPLRRGAEAAGLRSEGVR